MSWDEEWTNAGAKKHWEDEKQDEVKDEWDAESPDEDAPKPKPVSQKPKKALELAIERREQRELEEKLRQTKLKMAVAGVADTAGPADPVAEKLRQQKIVEDADLENAADLFSGVAGSASEVVKEVTLESMNPTTESEFHVFAEALATCALKFQKSKHYMSFLRYFCRKLMANMDSADLKDISSVVSVLYNERVKKEREETKGKAKKSTAPKKASLQVDSEFATYRDDDIDGFM